MIFLKQSTAIEIALGPFVDNTDGYTPETALTITQSEVRLKKNAGDWAQKNESTSLVHEENGWYRCLLDATDTNTLGILNIAVNESGALLVWQTAIILAANVYDALVGGGDTLDVQVAGMDANVVTASAIADGAIDAGALASDAITAAKIASGAITAAKFAAGAIDAAAIATDAIDADAVAASAVTEIQSGLSTLDAAGVRAAVGLAAANLDTQLAAIAAYIDTEVAAIKAKTDNLPTDPADASDIAASFSSIASTLATIAAYIDTEIATLLTAASAIQAKTDNLPSDPADASVIAGRFDTLDTSIDALPTNAELATALAGADDAVLAAIAALNDLSAAEVRTALGMASADLDTQLDAINALATAIKAVTDLLPDSGALSSLATAAALSALSTLATAIKSKTDSLTFTVAGKADANITHVISDAVQAGSSKETNWGGTP